MNCVRDREDRVGKLSDLSGLQVYTYWQRGTNYYVFGPTEQALKTVCTYRKAKVFAEGVATGRELGK
jgi:hypothetical protein